MDQEAGRKSLAPPAKKQSKACGRTRSGKAAMYMVCKQILCLFTCDLIVYVLQVLLMNLETSPRHKAYHSGHWTYIGPAVCS